MRKIVIDTETTGLHANRGDRIIELAAIEIVDLEITQNRIHRFFNPEREIAPEATFLHGLTSYQLRDAIRFPAFAHGFAEYIRGAELIIHNAPFDVEFLNAEFENAGLASVETYCHKITDTLAMAKRQKPGTKNALAALCERFDIEYEERTSKGAMLDAELLAEVYLKLVEHEDKLGLFNQ